MQKKSIKLNKTRNQILYTTLIFSLLFLVPTLIYSQGFGLVGCDGPECGFNDFMNMIQTVTNYAIGLAIATVSITIAYAGFIYMTAGGDSGKIAKAHEMFRKSAIGFIIVLSAFLIVRLIITTTGADEKGQLNVELIDR